MDNYLTLASNYGDVTAYWQGVDMTVNARTNNDLTLQGGFTTGAAFATSALASARARNLHADRIVAAQPPEQRVPRRGAVAVGVARAGQLHRAEGRRAGQRHHAVTAEHPGHQRSSVERPVMRANYFETNAAILAALGRPIAGGAPTVTLNLAKPGDVYPDRLNTVDMRFTKIVRIGRTRTNIGVDLYNLFNTNTGDELQPELRHRRLDVAASERDPEPALCALQRDGGLLKTRRPPRA